MASQRKRGPAAFCPRLSTGMLFAVFHLYTDTLGRFADNALVIAGYGRLDVAELMSHSKKDPAEAGS